MTCRTFAAATLRSGRGFELGTRRSAFSSPTEVASPMTRSMGSSEEPLTNEVLVNQPNATEVRR